jgi:hypothetical protein
VVRSDPERPEALELWVGSFQGEQLVAVAQLSLAHDSAPGQNDLADCARLGELGALALARLRPAPDDTQSREAAPGWEEIRDPATDLATLAFLSEVAHIELHKAQRFGRSFGLLCVELGEAPIAPAELVPVIDALRGCLRSTDILAREPAGAFWVLLAESDPLGGIVLKRRIAERIAGLAHDAKGRVVEVFAGLASFPQDGTSLDALLVGARRRTQEDRHSVVRELGLDGCRSFAELTRRLLESAELRPAALVSAAADLVIGDLASRPGDRGMLFLAPGPERSSFLAPLAALGQVETGTDVFVAVDGDTLPDGPSLHALPLSPRLGEQNSWIVRFGEAPPYALLAGPPEPDGARSVFHISDPTLVEHLAFQLRAEVGFGVRS